MAYMRDFNTLCQLCSASATKEVLNNHDSWHGYFCYDHAKEVVEKLTAVEFATGALQA